MSNENGQSSAPSASRCYLRFRDLERLHGSRFRYDNQIRSMRLSTPAYRDTASGTITVEKPWQLIGWCDQVDGNLMHGREGQIALMMWHPEEGEAWEHYPLYDQDDRDAAIFVSR
jgi:hypothetical protein